MPLATLPDHATRHAALIHRLGGEAWVVPVPASLPVPALEVGRLGPLPCWSIAAPPRSATAMARTLARRGYLGLMLADDAASGIRTLIVTIAPIRATVVPCDDLLPLAIRRLQRERLADAPLLAAAARAADALDIDAAGRRAFGMLHTAIDRVATALPAVVPRADREGWALLQATRLLFLRFVEAEGWLDGRQDFLRCAVDDVLARHRDPGRHLLHPLFFGTLNRRVRDRSRRAAAFGAVPFLNGGLFEPHALERARAWDLSRPGWMALFELVIDRIEVTLDPEAEDGRVTPGLLGRVFEGVMEPESRRAAGAYYTPPAMVRALVREAVACHLAPRVGMDEERLATALEDPDPTLLRRMSTLRVLDPAVGSGAFLVGTLDLLHGPGVRDARRVRHILTRQLHGVDRHPGAVRITELRLWLESLRAMRGRAPREVTPLPNLDTAIRAGDALLDPLHGHPLAPRAGLALAVHRRAVVSSHGSAKRAAVRALRHAERRTLEAALADHEAMLRDRVRDAVASTAIPTLFGERSAPHARDRQHLAGLRSLLRRVRRERAAMQRDATAAPFALETAYAPILERQGGFDLVVGNPPWVRAERLATATRTALGARYRWWRGSGNGYRHQPDLAIAFVERAVELLRPGGTVAFLLPSKLLTVSYARTARAALVHHHTLHRVADLAGDPRAGFDATIYPMALIASRGASPPGHGISTDLAGDGPRVPQADWRMAPTWSLADPEVQRLTRRLAEDFPTLGETHPPRLGVKTGANAAFLDPPAALAAWTRPAMRGRDFGPGGPRPGSRILWPADRRGEPWRELPPPVAAHLAQFRSRLEHRADQRGACWWRLFRTEAATAAHRVAWPDLAPTLRATATLPADVVPLNSCYVVVAGNAEQAEVIARWLTTTWMRALAALGAEAAAGGYRRFGARVVGGLPFPARRLGMPFLQAEDADAFAAVVLQLSPDEQRALRDVATNPR